MEKKELVSVIITSFNVPKKLNRAINSVLSQSYEAIEVIVVDDNDPESDARKATEILMKQYEKKSNVKYLKHEKNKNGAVARNTGIQNARGEYIAFLDNDDIYLPGRISCSVELLKKELCFGAVVTSVLLTEDGYPIAEITPNIDAELSWKLLCGSETLGTGSNLFFRRCVVEDIGDFDTRFLRYQDLEYFLRVCTKYKIGLIKKRLIIKDSEVGKITNYKKMKEITELYLEKFQYIISEMPIEKRNECYAFHYTNLLDWAIQSNDKAGIEIEYDQIKALGLAGDFQNNLYSDRRKRSIRFAIVRKLKSVKLLRILLHEIRTRIIWYKSIRSFSSSDRKSIRQQLSYCK